MPNYDICSTEKNTGFMFYFGDVCAKFAHFLTSEKYPENMSALSQRERKGTKESPWLDKKHIKGKHLQTVTNECPQSVCSPS